MENSTVQSVQIQHKELQNQAFYLAIPLNPKSILSDEMKKYKNSFIFAANKQIVTFASKEYFNNQNSIHDEDLQQTVQNITIKIKIFPGTFEFPLNISSNSDFNDLSQLVIQSYPDALKFNTIDWFYDGKAINSNSDLISDYINDSKNLTFIGISSKIEPYYWNYFPDQSTTCTYIFQRKNNGKFEAKISVSLKPTLTMDEVQTKLWDLIPEWNNHNMTFYYNSNFVKTNQIIGKYNHNSPFTVILKGKQISATNRQQQSTSENTTKVRFCIKGIKTHLNQVIELDVSPQTKFKDISAQIVEKFPEANPSTTTLVYSDKGKPRQLDDLVLTDWKGSPIIVTIKEKQQSGSIILHFLVTSTGGKYQLSNFDTSRPWSQVKEELSSQYPEIPRNSVLLYNNEPLADDATVKDTQIEQDSYITIQLPTVQEQQNLPNVATEENIKSLMDLNNKLDRQTAIYYLNQTNNDLSKAVNLSYQNQTPNISQNSINEFIEVTGTTAEDAQRYLNQAEGDLTRAFDNYYREH